MENTRCDTDKKNNNAVGWSGFGKEKKREKWTAEEHIFAHEHILWLLDNP